MKVIYDKQLDSLLIYFSENRPAISEDVNGELWLRKDPVTKEIIGIEIEDFRRYFYTKYILSKL